MKNRKRDAARWTWGRLVDAPEPGGYLALQWPVTRTAALSVMDKVTYYEAQRVICEAITSIYADHAARVFTAEDSAKAMEWHRQHPPIGFKAPRWRVQWPVRRVAGGHLLYAASDLGLQESALWRGAKAGMKAADPPWAEEFRLWRAELGLAPARDE